ncbi:MAG: helix-turn-helix transcriptional regulator [Myxococcaceae bacterium]
MRRQARLFALAEHLRARRTGVTASELAERFGVAVRTVYRDLDALREAELPVSAERGRGGGYALDRTYSLPPVNFTAREAALVSALGRWAIDARLVPFTRTLGSAIDKVRGALAASAQRELLTLMKELIFLWGFQPIRQPQESERRLRMLGSNAARSASSTGPQTARCRRAPCWYGDSPWSAP